MLLGLRETSTLLVESLRLLDLNHHHSARMPIMTAKKTLSKTAHPTAGSPASGLATIGGYLIQRLQDYGVRHVFGIPGDFVLQFYGMLNQSPIKVVGTTNEACAGYAADGYARVNGMGAVCVTYCVGGLSICNPIAGAFAEKSPVIVISGAPGMAERVKDPLLHHKVRDFNTQRDVFEKITVRAALLDDPLTAFREIDRCFEAAHRFKRPVYLELPRDRVQAHLSYEYVPNLEPVVSDKQALKESLDEAVEQIEKARQPVIIAGIEMHRFGLQREVIRFAEKHGIPICATLLGKSVVSEKHPLYLGVYEGAMGRERVRKYVESSDCVILLGTFMTDINLGIFTAHLDPGRCIYATSEQLRIRHHFFHDVLLADFIKGLGRRSFKLSASPARIEAEAMPVPKVKPSDPVSLKYLMHRIDQTLEQQLIVVADVGDSLFASADLTIHQHNEFLSPAYYTSMGFAIPAALGAQMAKSDRRPLVLVGDGAFQMTGMELSTILRHGFNPIVIVLNNHGYTTERFIQEGPFNDIPCWNYHCLPAVLGGGLGLEARTNAEFDAALSTSLANEKSFSLINVHLRPDDTSMALQRLAERLAKQV